MTRRLPLAGTTCGVNLLSTRNLAMSSILFHEGMANRHLSTPLARPCICRICPDVRMCRLRFDPLIRPSLECQTPLQPLHRHLNRLRLVWSMAPDHHCFLEGLPDRILHPTCNRLAQHMKSLVACEVQPESHRGLWLRDCN